MKYRILLLMLFYVELSAQNRRFTISGNITDGATSEDLIGATVYVEEPKTGTTANEDVKSVPEMEEKTNSPRRMYLEFNAQNGILMNRRNDVILANHSLGFDVRVGWQTDDFEKNTYDYLFRFPQYGIGYYMGNLNNIILHNEEMSGFGKPFALYAFFAAPIVREHRYSVYYDISLGLATNFKTYDPHLRPFNTLIGANQNVYVNIRFSSDFSVSESATFGLGISYTHFSNGSIKKPNNGIDLLSINLLYQTNFFKKSDKSYHRCPIETFSPVWEWHLNMAIGGRMLDTDFDLNSPHYKQWYCNTTSLAVLRQISHRRKVGIGLDYFYYDWGRYVKEYRAKEQGLDVITRERDNSSIGAYLTHEVGYKNLWLYMHVGFYVTEHISDYPNNLWIYERIGVKYNLNRNISLGVAIKAHLFAADYVEWSLGFSMRGKKVKIA